MERKVSFYQSDLMISIRKKETPVEGIHSIFYMHGRRIHRMWKRDRMRESVEERKGDQIGYVYRTEREREGEREIERNIRNPVSFYISTVQGVRLQIDMESLI